MGAEAGEEDEKISEHRIAILAKECPKHMGISFHDAKVKPVAECVAMEKADYVDAVMSNNSDAFLFGARRVLYHDKTRNGVIMVKDFLACNLLSAMPPYLRSIQQVFLTANLLANSVAFCGPAIACQLGASTYGNELWKLVENKQWKRDLIEDWTRRVAEQFQTNSDGLFETTCPVIAKDLSNPSNTERFYDPMVIESLMEGLELQKRRPHYTQAKISDFYSDDSAQSPDVPVISSSPTSPHARPVLGEISTNSTPKSNRSERVKKREGAIPRMDGGQSRLEEETTPTPFEDKQPVTGRLVSRRLLGKLWVWVPI
ncbi:hypothetical protein PG993_010461 [Apiospora rasikravindrae]|uniref:XPG-I domain-containing protein n=1 Tax=Apiospora rasikravindrae TaxID=990691 RepID=A0ABR1SNM8_9PEZI